MQVSQQQSLEHEADGVPVEHSEVYVTMGLPHPYEAYQRSVQNAQHYLKGKWLKTWWQHRIEPLAATATGISLLKDPTAYSYEKFQQCYAKLAASLDATEELEVEVCQFARRRQLTRAEQLLRLQKLKDRVASW